MSAHRRRPAPPRGLPPARPRWQVLVVRPETMTCVLLSSPSSSPAACRPSSSTSTTSCEASPLCRVRHRGAGADHGHHRRRDRPVPAANMALSACLFACCRPACRCRSPCSSASLAGVGDGRLQRASWSSRLQAALDHRHHRHADALSRPGAGHRRRQVDRASRTGSSASITVLDRRHPAAGPDLRRPRRSCSASSSAPPSSAARSTRSAPTRSPPAMPASAADRIKIEPVPR